MSFGGDPTAWLDLIESQVPAVLRLVLSTWEEMPSLPADALEDPTTETLCRALRKNRSSASLPFRIDIQMVELGPAADQTQGRMDITFSPMVPHEAFYFCLECKRLNVTVRNQKRSLAREYVIHGMSRFVTRQYGDQVRHGGMLGYVLDGRIDSAINLVRKAVGSRRQHLLIVGDTVLQKSSFAPDTDNVLESLHSRAGAAQPFLIQHIFVPAA